MTDQTASLPEPNWYPDPEVPGALRWWDGGEWRGRMSAPVTIRPVLASGFQVRSVGLVVLLATSVAIGVASSCLYLWGTTRLADDLDAGRYGSASRYDALDQAIGVVDMLLLVVTAVCWCVWQHRLARSAPRYELRRSAGMHVGSWFIPVVSLWFPLQNMRDLWDVYRPARGRAVLGWWWAFWLVGIFLDRTAYSMRVGDDVDDFRAYTTLWLWISLATIVLSVLAIYVVVTLSRAALAVEGQPASASGTE